MAISCLNHCVGRSALQKLPDLKYKRKFLSGIMNPFVPFPTEKP